MCILMLFIYPTCYYLQHNNITQIRQANEQHKDKERKFAILSNLEPLPRNNIFDPNDVVDLWVHYFEGAHQRNSNGTFNWSSIVLHVTNFAFPERPSILLPRAGYKDCSTEIRMKNRHKIKKPPKNTFSKSADESVKKHLLDPDSK